MKYLVDANVLSELTRPTPRREVVQWLSAHNDDLAVNPIIRGELLYGVLILPPGRKRNRLLQWFEQGVGRMRVLDFDAETGDVWAALIAQLRRKGRAMPVKDSLVAATARRHNLIVVTRNATDFTSAGVELINPFQDPN